MASGKTFLSKALNGTTELLSAISSFTGNAEEIVATNSSGVLDKDLVLKAPYVSTGWRFNLTATSFLREDIFGDLTNINPIRLAFDCEIIAITASNRLADTDGWTAQIYINGGLVPALNTVVSGGSAQTQNILVTPVAVSANSQISTQAVLTSPIQRPKVKVYYQRT